MRTVDVSELRQLLTMALGRVKREREVMWEKAISSRVEKRNASRRRNPFIKLGFKKFVAVTREEVEEEFRHNDHDGLGISTYRYIHRWVHCNDADTFERLVHLCDVTTTHDTINISDEYGERLYRWTGAQA